MSRTLDPEKIKKYAGAPRVPLVHATWLAALKGPVTITLDTRAEYQRLRMQLYRHRYILLADKDPIGDALLNFTIITGQKPGGKFTLSIQALSDDKIYEALRAAGIQTTTEDVDDLLNPET
jgi:hypothetical protein